MNEQNEQPPIEIPQQSLSPETLASVIESFILREGTDYGAHEVELSVKVEQIHKQLQRGDIKIVFDPNTETVSLVTKRDWLGNRPAVK